MTDQSLPLQLNFIPKLKILFLPFSKNQIMPQSMPQKLTPKLLKMHLLNKQMKDMSPNVCTQSNQSSPQFNITYSPKSPLQMATPANPLRKITAAGMLPEQGDHFRHVVVSPVSVKYV